MGSSRCLARAPANSGCSDAVEAPNSSARDGLRAQIVDVANDLFAQRGYAGVSMRIVAGEVGRTKPALYYHFEDKNVLYQECIAMTTERLARALAHAVERGGDLRERIDAVTRVLLHVMAHHPAVLMRDAHANLPEDAARALTSSYLQSMTNPLVKLFSNAAVTGEIPHDSNPAAAAASLIALCSAAGRPINALDVPSDDVQRPPDSVIMDENAQWIVHLMVGGLRAGELSAT